jgi:hypothetical protein
VYTYVCVCVCVSIHIASTSQSWINDDASVDWWCGRGLQEAAAKKGSEIEGLKISAMGEQLKDFKARLQDFALKHKKEIQKDPIFRYSQHATSPSLALSPSPSLSLSLPLENAG